MRRTFKRLLVVMLVLAIMVGNIPADMVLVKADVLAESFTLDLTAATQGAYNPATGTIGATKIQGTEFRLTTSYAGDGWRLNPDKTTLPISEEGSTVYDVGGYNSTSNKAPGASVRLHRDYARINFNCGNTIAFYFDAEISDEYVMKMTYYDNSTPESMDVTVNGQTQHFPKQTTNSVSMKEYVFEQPVTLVAGSTNTLELTEATGQYMETNIKSLTFIKIPFQTITVESTKPVVQELDKDGVQLLVKGIADDGQVVKNFTTEQLSNYEMIFTALNPEILRVDENGLCYYVSRGDAQVKVEVIYEGISFESVIDLVSSSQKTGRTLYTDEMVANARYNVANYQWAQNEVKNRADGGQKYVDDLEKLYALIPSEGVPRSYENATCNVPDDMKWVCPVCQINFKRTDATYMTDALSEPWKIWCSNCQSRFPSNDFALLYERGLDENGEYNRELAYQRNAEAVARGEKDALVNELYPEKGTTWMVDDGFGWSPTSGTYGTKDMLQYAPIAHYMYKWWHGQKENNITDALVKTRDYYLWTGDEIYGRAGAILLDRVADLYPSYDVAKVSLNYQLSHGGGNSGKIIGSITESKEVVDVFAQCYDAFYPMFDDPEVIAFLSEKAAEKGLENPKTNGNLIRENIENGLLREAFESAKTCKVYGNFGLHQRSITMVAIALDTQPETNEIFEWLNAPSVITKSKIVDPIFGGTYSVRSTNSGGELAVKFANDIDRDGFGGEISIDYNYLWYKTLEIAEILENYDTSVIDFFSNPKFINMFESFIHMTGGAGGSRNAGYTFLFGDGGRLGSNKFVTLAQEMVIAYKITKDPLYAQLFHLYNAGNYNNANLGIYNNIAELTASMKNDVATYGEYKFKSLNLTGYGLSIVRGGKAATKYDPVETRYDTWMYYGRTNVSHGHLDMLHMGIDAYGFNFMPDLGYPEATLDNANRYEWIKNTLSHNTVTVNETWQSGVYTGTPLHYDVTEKVKVIDNECADAYKDTTDIYRRSLVTIAANDDVSYTIDFFRVKGGDKHTYSFHSQSYKNFFTEDLVLTPQVDANGEYVGTYAGPAVPYGPDPNSTDSKYAQNPVYPRGYTWLTDVNRGKDKTGDGEFTVKFEQTDWNSQVADSNGLAMKLHAVNDWEPDSVDIMVGYPPRIKENSKIPGYDYMLIQRSGENLDTLFTTVMEPYKMESYIAKVDPLKTTIVNGSEGVNDISKVVKVTLENNRVDYVIYATNKDVTYRVTDGNVSFDFKGFVGVFTTDYEGNHIYSYVNDGTIIGNMTSVGAYTGTVVDFTKEWTLDDYIIIKADQEIEDVSVLNNQYIYVANTGAKCNGAFRIVSAEKQGENIALYLGNCSLIEGCVDNYNLDAGYLYSVASGQAFRIPVSNVTTLPTPEPTPSPILILELTEATEGAYNPSEGTTGGTYVQGTEFQLTTAYAGKGWRLNAEKTTLPLMEEGSDIYARGTYSSDSTQEAGASVRLHKDYQRINFNYGNTIAFDFDVEVSGDYYMIMSYYDNSTPEKMSVTVNGVTQNVPQRNVGSGYGTGVMRDWNFEIPVTLVAGSDNALELKELRGDYMETNVGAIRFVKCSTVNEYTVTWMNFDGTVLATETYAYGEIPEYKGYAPVYGEYTFTGWTPAISAVEGDITYTAQFEMSGNSIEWFDEDGNGVAETGYYYVDGAVKKGAGLVQVGDYLYWVLSTGKVAVGTYRTIKENQTNGLVEAGTYYFFNNGVLATQEVKLDGEIRWVEENGKTYGYYYVQGEVCKDVGLVEIYNPEAEETCWYDVLYSGKVKKNYVADGKRVNQTIKVAKLNNYTGSEGLYSFYEDGVMYDPLATETGIVKYDETGKPWYYVDGHIRKDAGLVYVQRGDLAGNYIFVTFSGTLKKGTQSIKEKTCNGHTEFIGIQRFDSNTGAMIIK